MSAEIITLEANLNQRQIFAHINPNDLDDDEPLPDKIMAEIRLEIAKLKSAGLIEEFNVYEQDLRSTWTRLLKKPQLIRVLVADGFPKMPGLQCEVINKNEAILRFDATRFVAKSWQTEWLNAFLNFYLQRTDIDPNAASLALQYHWARFIYNGHLNNTIRLPLIAPKSIVGDKAQAILHADPEKNVVYVKFASALSCRFDSFAAKSIFNRMINTLRHLASRGGASGFYAVRRRHLKRLLEQIPLSEARIGINLPKTILAGLVVNCDADDETAVIPGLPFGYLELVATAIFNLMKRIGSQFSEDYLLTQLVDFGLSSDSIVATMQHLKKKHFVIQKKSGVWQTNASIRWRGFRLSGFPLQNFDLACTQFHSTQLSAKITKATFSDVMAIPESLAPTIQYFCRQARQEICNFADSSCADPHLLMLAINFLPLSKQTRATSTPQVASGIDISKYGADCGKLNEFLRTHLAPNQSHEWLCSQWLAPIPSTAKNYRKVAGLDASQRVVGFSDNFLSESAFHALSSMDSDRAHCQNIIINIPKQRLEDVEDILQKLRAKVLVAVSKATVANQIYGIQAVGLPVN